jgi:hypothetical protein
VRKTGEKKRAVICIPIELQSAIDRQESEGLGLDVEDQGLILDSTILLDVIASLKQYD